MKTTFRRLISAEPAANEKKISNPAIVSGVDRKIRKDIDGLRAIAVASVIFYHTHIPFIRGGFVGVDIFFVISGYLISEIICRDIDSGNFDLATFYERRIRRIFPALFVLLVVVDFLGFLFLVPQSYKQMVNSSSTAALSFSNVYFYRHHGYFDIGSTLLPLLHTWSLGVEVQFYAIIPLVFLFLRRRFGWSWPLIVSSMTILSFACCVLQTSLQPTAAFYLPLARCWEFLVGSLLATSIRKPKPLEAEIAGIVGLVLIVLCVFLLNDQVAFPGLAALMPVSGAALIIHSGRSDFTATARMLSLRPLVFIGLISYSLYLFHWPILVFAESVSNSRFSALELIFLLVAMIVIATLSWWLVERPIRVNRNLITQKRLLAGALVLTSALLGANFAIGRIGHGLPQRYNSAALTLARGAEDVNPRRSTCTGQAVSEVSRGRLCEIGKEAAPISFALLGDSYADAMMPGVDQAAAAAGRRGVVLVKPGCYPLPEIKSKPDCSRFFDAGFDWLKSHPEIHTLLIVGRWTTAVDGYRVGSVDSRDMFIADVQTTGTGYEENKAVVLRSLRRLGAMFSDRRVFVLAHIPEQHENVPTLSSMLARFGYDPDLRLARDAFDRREADARTILERSNLGRSIRVIDASPAFCDKTWCYALREGRSLYADDNHVSNFGAEEIARSGLLAPVFFE